MNDKVLFKNHFKFLEHDLIILKSGLFALVSSSSSPKCNRNRKEIEIGKEKRKKLSNYEILPFTESL